MFIADFHIHSKYSRATSKECIPEFLDLWARRKGLDLIGTGDFTHPGWRSELREKLAPVGNGLYTLKQEYRKEDSAPESGRDTHFIVTGEISSIYKKNGKVRKIHNLIVLPGLEEAEALALRLEQIGNLHSDGRPIIGLDSRDLLEITLDICPEALLIPAHIWTPHFSLFGAYSGFDDIHECFGDLTGHIHALETGLSSNPPMNWRLSALDRYTLVSNSDAHSPGNLAREANLFDTELSYAHIIRALKERDSGAFQGTIEFYPEEGKYHFDGHRNCNVCQSPSETLADGGRCPVCGGRITVGVLHRVEALADRREGYTPERPPHFESLIPLPEVIAASTGFSPKSIKGRKLYDHLLRELGPELHILREASIGDIGQAAGPSAAEGIRRLRRGDVKVEPGYDGAYGKVKILEAEEIEQLSGQMRLFVEAIQAPGEPPAKTKKPVKRRAAVKRTPPVQSDTGRTDVLADLNEEQRRAVLSDAPVTAVVAGPGTGKTKTLVARIAHLVENCGVQPAQITAVTFTNRAAGEMKARLEGHFGGGETVRAMRVGTFHSICLDLLRARGGVALLDDTAAARLLRDVLRELGVKHAAKDALLQISLKKCGCAAREKESLPPAVHDAYCARLEELNVLDYDDLLLRALERDCDGIQPETGFHHLLVDEFQDSNPLQYRLTQKWAAGSRGLFVIGDPDQSIYGFRGADARCFEWLRRDHPAADTITLVKNYRSTPEILEAATAVMRRDSRSCGELEAQREGGDKARLVHADSAFREALYVVKEIGRMVGGMDMLDSHLSGGVAGMRGLSDIAVLYRTNRQAAVLEECLVQEGIPYVLAGKEDYLTQAEPAKMLAFFRLAANPADLVSLWSCLQDLADCAPEQARLVLDSYKGTDKTIPALLQTLEQTLPGRDGAIALAELLSAYAGAVDRRPPGELIADWAKRFAQAESPWVEKLVCMAVFHRTMPDLLCALALGQEADIRRYGGKVYTGDAVSLLTMHGAKGLEFPVVFLCGATEGLIPYKGYVNAGADQEERRLLYVGMTRAGEELVVLNHGKLSPMIADLPPVLFSVGRENRRKVPPEYRQISLFDA